MSTSEMDPVIEVEEGGGEPDLEFVELGEGQEAPQEVVEPKPAAPVGVQLTAEQLQELIGKAGGGSAAMQGLEKIVERVGQAQPVQQYTPPPPVLSGEEFEKELFKPGNTAETLKKFIAEQLAPVQAQQTQALVQQNKELLKLRPETGAYFKKYEAEIEQLVRGAPAHVRMQPNVYEQAYQAVMANKQGEIIADQAKKMAEEMVAKALADAGITPKKGPAVQMEGAPGGAVKPKAVQKVYITGADKRDMVERGLDPNDKEQLKFYWEKYVKGRK